MKACQLLNSFRFCILAVGLIGTGKAQGETDGSSSTPILKLNDVTISRAVSEWISNPELATETYGDIQTWDVSRVTDMQRLFEGLTEFNDDISNWNTMRVTSMAFMFSAASSFNQDLPWDTRHVKYIDGVFNMASSFNGDITSWETSSLLSMDYAFSHASKFNQDISSFDTSQTKYMAYAFWNATSFSQDLSSWSVKSVDDMEGMFHSATSFNHTLCWNDLRESIHITKLFCGSQGSLDPKCVSSELRAIVDEECASDTGKVSDPPVVDEGSSGEANVFSASPGNNVESTQPGPETASPTSEQQTAPQAFGGLFQGTPDSNGQHDNLKYVAIAFATVSLAVMLFLILLVLYKRRQIKAIHREHDSPTVVEDDVFADL